MALWICTDCTAAYSVGAPKCPQCSSTEHVEEGAEDMPKITVHGGPSIAGASVTGGSWSNEGDPDTWPEPAEVEGGEESSPGSSSSTSDETPSSDSEQSEKPSRKRAPTTASRSKKAQTGGSSADSTDGGQTEATSETGSADDK